MTTKLDDRRHASPFCLDTEAIPGELSITMAAQGLNGERLAALSEIDVKQRAELIRAVRAGEHAELSFTARTFRQRDGKPNRKFVRIKRERLGKAGRSGKGNPFLLDHLQMMQRARLGTVLASSAVDMTEDSNLAEGEIAFRQRIITVKPEGVIGVLDGTIDRFSVGFRALGKVICSVHGTPARTSCRCWAGEEVEVDGVKRIVEYEFSDAELVEVSTVNVPAVLGTEIEEIRAALAAEIETHNGRSYFTMSNLAKLAAHLGCAAAATEDEILAAVQQREQRAGAELEVARQRAINAEQALAPLQTQLAELQRTARAASVDAAIAEAYASGRLLRATDAQGGSQPDPFEASLRKLGAAAGLDVLAAALAEVPARAPIGLAPHGAPGQGRPSPLPGLQPQLDDQTVRSARQLGLSEEDLHRYGPQQGGR